MCTHTAAGEGVLVPSDQGVPVEVLRRCRAELSSDLLDDGGTLIERLIDLAFNTLGVRALDLRVTTAVRSHLMITVQDARLSSQL